jgi:Flp pilus assembly protein TadG
VIRRYRKSDIWRQFRGDRRAVASVEFAFSALALFVFMFTIINLGDLGLVLGTMQHGVEIAARAAAVQTEVNLAQSNDLGTCATQSQVLASFNSIAAPTLPMAAGTVTAGRPDIQDAWTNNAAGNSVSGTFLTVTAHYLWMPVGLPFSFGQGVPLSIAVTQMVLGTTGATTSCS